MNVESNASRYLGALNIVLLLVILAGGAYLRYLDLGVSLYDDEINTRDRALQSAAYTLESRNYPLYYLAAKAALYLGDTEEILRLPSFIAGLLSILVLYGFVRQLHSRSAGLLAAALLAVSPFHIVHSTFARYYALVMLFTLLTAWFLYHVLRKGRWYAWLGYAVSAFLALSSHICFVPALFGLNAGAALYLLGDRSRGRVIRRMGAVALLALCSTLAAGNMIYRGLGPSGVFRMATPVEAPPAEPKGASAEPAGAGVVAAAPDAVPEAVFRVQQSRPEGGGRTVTNVATGDVRYKLTFFDCVAYLKRFFWNVSAWLWPLLVVAGVWGVVDLCFRRPAAGLPLATGFVLSPLPLYFVTAGHWYHPRYFSYAYMFALVLVSVGFCVLPQFVARLVCAPRSIRLWRRAAAPLAGRRRAVTGGVYAMLVVGIAAALSPALWRAYMTYPMDGYLPQFDVHLPGYATPVNKTPARDYRGAFASMAETVRDGDPILYMHDRGEYSPLYARHYLSQFASWEDEELRLDESFGPPSPALLRALAREHPLSNLWFLGYLRYNALDFAPLFNAYGAVQKKFLARNQTKGLVLYELGAPTTNYVHGGDFDGDTTLEIPDGVRRVLDGAYEGRVAAEIQLLAGHLEGGIESRYLRIPVEPARYRLRNGSFEAWHDGMPAGWRLSEGVEDGVVTQGAGHESPSGLQLGVASAPTVLAQTVPVGLAPGRTLSVRAMGRSATTDNLHLAVHFQGPGYQREHRVTHGGSDAWEPLEMAVPIPEDADPETVVVEVVRLAGGEGDVLVDDIRIGVEETGASLDPLTPYVLSLAVRTEDLHHAGGSNRQAAGRVQLAWKSADGRSGKTVLMEVHDDPAWRLLSAVIEPGIDFPVALETLVLEVGIEEGTGTLWVDQIQLEPGTRPTTYTRDERLPHDETLSGIDLDTHAVPVPWGGA